MKNFNIANLSRLGVGLLLLGVGFASAQSVRHDVMDAGGARADIVKLKAERRAARRAHNWGKVRQDNRLIAADRKFLHRDVRKVIRAGE